MHRTHECEPFVKQLHPDPVSPVSLDPVSLTPFPPVSPRFPLIAEWLIRGRHGKV